MNFLRCSPLRPLALASLLQNDIFSCCGVSFLPSAAALFPTLAGSLAVGLAASAAAGLPARQSFMNALRASPVFPAASLLHCAMRLCCGVAWACASRGRDSAPSVSARVAISLFMIPPSVLSGNGGRCHPSTGVGVPEHTRRPARAITPYRHDRAARRARPIKWGVCAITTFA